MSDLMLFVLERASSQLKYANSALENVNSSLNENSVQRL
jgi:hypothetical protein